MGVIQVLSFQSFGGEVFIVCIPLHLVHPSWIIITFHFTSQCFVSFCCWGPDVQKQHQKIDTPYNTKDPSRSYIPSTNTSFRPHLSSLLCPIHVKRRPTRKESKKASWTSRGIFQKPVFNAIFRKNINDGALCLGFCSCLHSLVRPWWRDHLSWMVMKDAILYKVH